MQITTEKLVEQIKRVEGVPDFDVEHHEVKPWASITFSGERHKLTVTFDLQENLTDFAEALSNHEFSIPRMLVADVHMHEPTKMTYPVEGQVVQIHFLTIKDE